MGGGGGQARKETGMKNKMNHGVEEQPREEATGSGVGRGGQRLVRSAGGGRKGA